MTAQPSPVDRVLHLGRAPLAALRRTRWFVPEPQIGLYAQGVVFDGAAQRRILRDTAELADLDANHYRIVRADAPGLAAIRTSEADLLARVAARVDPAWHPLALDCAADLHVLTHALPAPVAGWNANWRYVWPRDAAHTLVVLAELGRSEEVVTGLGFLARHLREDGWFDARYTLGGGVPDARERQKDGNGWFLWALEAAVRALPEARGAIREAVAGTPARAARRILEDLDPATGLPGPSPDYWEVGETRLTLGTAAPLLAGLQAASRLPAEFRIPGEVNPAARHLAQAIHRAFGTWGYRRYARPWAPRDAAVTFLLPPYVTGFERDAGHHLDASWRSMRRPAGGVAPGAGWKDRYVSWTPQTALFAQASAAVGDLERAARILHWLARHRTELGALPEKVMADGSPAAVAPLAWTASIVLSTLVRDRVPPPRESLG